MRPLVAPLLALLAACGSEGTESSAAPISVSWDCSSGVRCPGATLRTIAATLPITECEWACGTYQGRTGRVVAELQTVCRATSRVDWSAPLPAECPGGVGSECSSFGEYGCTSSGPWCSSGQTSIPGGVHCERECATVYCGAVSSTATLSIDVLSVCQVLSVVIDERNDGC